MPELSVYMGDMAMPDTLYRPFDDDDATRP